jgi:hypothetical protein
MTNIPERNPNPNQAAVNEPQPLPMLTPEEAVEQIRALRARIPDVMPLTVEQRRQLRNRAKMPEPVIQASINAIGISDVIAQGVGVDDAAARQMVEEANRWTALEDELRITLNGVAGGNLSRRQQIRLLASRAYGFGRQVVRVPENEALASHLDEIRRVRKLTSRRKRTQTPETPSPAPATPPLADASQTPKTS